MRAVSRCGASSVINGQRPEALDCLVNASAAGAAFTFPLETRAVALAQPPVETPRAATQVRPAATRSAWIDQR